MATLNIGARYFALFLMLGGTYGCFQISNAWMANIGARPRKKRAVALAMNNSIGNTALVWTPYLYPSSDGPRYLMGEININNCSQRLLTQYYFSSMVGQSCTRCSPTFIHCCFEHLSAKRQQERPDD